MSEGERRKGKTQCTSQGGAIFKEEVKSKGKYFETKNKCKSRNSGGLTWDQILKRRTRINGENVREENGSEKGIQFMSNKNPKTTIPPNNPK